MARKASLLSDPFLDKEQLSFSKLALRRASYRWRPRNEAIKAARVERGLYRCNSCEQLVRNKDKQLDHIKPVIRTRGLPQSLGEFAARLFCQQDGFAVLCKDCHQTKSRKENKQRK